MPPTNLHDELAAFARDQRARIDALPAQIKAGAELVLDELDALLPSAPALPPTPPGDAYLTTEEAALFARVAPKTIRKWARLRKLQVQRTAGGKLRIHRGTLEQLLDTSPAQDWATPPNARNGVHA